MSPSHDAASPSSLAAAMFDMDGVLIQSREVIERAWWSVARDHGIDLTEDDIRDHVHGRPGSYTADHVFAALSIEGRRAVRQRVDALEETSDCELTAGLATLLRELATAGVPTALVTSSWPARIAYVLRQHELTEHFHTIVHRNDVAHGKPDPAGYLLAAQRLGVAPRACVVFEDSHSGVIAAVRSGATCVGIGDDSSLIASGAVAFRTNFVGLRLQDLMGLPHIAARSE